MGIYHLQALKLGVLFILDHVGVLCLNSLHVVDRRKEPALVPLAFNTRLDFGLKIGSILSDNLFLFYFLFKKLSMFFIEW